MESLDLPSGEHLQESELQIHSADGHECWGCQRVSLDIPPTHGGHPRPLSSEDGEVRTIVEKLPAYRMCRSLHS